MTMTSAGQHWCAVPILLSLMTLEGCAGTSAIQVGQTAGTIAGALIAPGVGAPVGNVVGLLAGLAVQDQIDKGTERRERQELGQQMSAPQTPAADETIPSPHAQPTRVWVDEAVRDGRLVHGHFEVRYLP